MVEGFAPVLDTVVFRLGPDPPNARPARVQLLDDGECISVDLGQVARGHRYAYQASTSSASDSESAPSALSTVVRDAISSWRPGTETA
ncbi:hypothetical protein CNMCM5793_000588 [Aspergillus hiratsukae]|uniref:Uncharacterized protein n=1 Tax=Aspergillus hiratsukae TaxID=1194566 RepID=A0A8H6UXH1_9EURO|nr:hypothetical protein CNMCM5793_000588 [Aspergillus hiratsukae]KAF7169750.1 hypothetical protein CNMCM6106_004540 [Aspergillus hiratsukae]